ncbi:MAG: leucine--tRNA ligase [Planctomycetes bacterium]|nr:leucine--tRNA ligase [Planctomycetota bacterium]
MQYDFTAIEKRWQERWAQLGTFRTLNPGDPGFDPNAPKYYVLDMFPYPSGVGLHVGHPLGYIATDIIARYKRTRGFNVLHPMGYDAFGLPAEQFAVEHGVHPRITTEKNIANMTRQLKRLGLSYDWDRALATTDEEYYRWTQWIFLQLHNAWFDPSKKQARPIAELIRGLESEQYLIDADGELVYAGAGRDLTALTGQPIGTRTWGELTQEARLNLLDEVRLAYLAEVNVNWCPALGTVLANEEVTNDGKSERGNHPVFKRPLKQWMLRITALADRLESDLSMVDWPEAIKLMQRNWIGRSTGARVEFDVAFSDGARPRGDSVDVGEAGDGSETISVFTTRPDTLFGATYMVLAPEHPMVESLTSGAQWPAVEEYRRQTAAKSDAQRQAEAASGQKTGVFTGGYALNPVNNERIPVWIADYVMTGYGTGAIMAVPAHDERDWAFAKQFHLPIRQVVAPADGKEIDITVAAFCQEGVAVDSANESISLDGRPTAEAKALITRWLEENGLGRGMVQYKLRDWLFSRQRYWGEPFPVLHAPDGRVVALDESELPVRLPEMADFSPTASDDPAAPPQPPLARAPDAWKYVTRSGTRYARELNTMPQWAGSCWYYLRFIDPKNGKRFVSAEAERYWMKGGIDLYVGGAEHAVLHLLYARFWHKVLFDLGHVSTPEPFGRLFNQGYIQAHAYTDARGVYLPAEEIQERGGKHYHNGEEVKQEFGKMGKSLKNSVAPDEVCDQYGCDTLRLYEMYLGPLDQSKVWNTRDIIGVHRFLQRVWRLFIDETTGNPRVADAAPSPEVTRLLHKTIKRVTDAMEALSFNVAIAALIEMNNELLKQYPPEAKDKALPIAVAEPFVLMLAPLAPHMAEELWSKLGHADTLARERWPSFDPQMLVEETVEYPVQINGKLRGRVTVPSDADNLAIETAARADEKVQASLDHRATDCVAQVLTSAEFTAALLILSPFGAINDKTRVVPKDAAHDE